MRAVRCLRRSKTLNHTKVPCACARGAVILVLAGSVSSVSTVGVRCYSILAGMFLIASGILMVVLLPIVAPVRQPASFVFLHFDPGDMARAALFQNISSPTSLGRAACTACGAAACSPEMCAWVRHRPDRRCGGPCCGLSDWVCCAQGRKCILCKVAAEHTPCVAA